MGQNVGTVKVTNQFRRHQSFNPLLQDQPFTQYGGTNRAIGGRRLNGSMPQIWNRQLHLRESNVQQREFALVDPHNPFLVEVVGETNVDQYFPLEVVDTFVVGTQSRRNYYNIPLERSFKDPADTTITNALPFIFSIVKRQDLLDLTITVDVANAGLADTFTINWGDGNTDIGLATGAVTTHTYAATGIFDVSVSLDSNPADIKTETLLITDATYVPAPLAFVTPITFASAARNLTSTITVDGAPFIKIFVDFGDNPTGDGRSTTPPSPQEFFSFLPTAQTLTSSTFQIQHQYKHAGSYVVRIFAEHLVDDMHLQERRQIVHVQSVAVS